MSKSFKVMGTYKNEERAKEIAEDMLKKNEDTSVPELHQWLRACKRENARKKSQGHNGTKKQTKDLHI